MRALIYDAKIVRSRNAQCKTKGITLRWPNTVFVRPLTNAVQPAHKYRIKTNMASIQRSFYLLNLRAIYLYYLGVRCILGICQVTAKYRQSISKLKSASVETVISTDISTEFRRPECRPAIDRVSTQWRPTITRDYLSKILSTSLIGDSTWISRTEFVYTDDKRVCSCTLILISSKSDNGVGLRCKKRTISSKKQGIALFTVNSAHLHYNEI